MELNYPDDGKWVDSPQMFINKDGSLISIGCIS